MHAARVMVRVCGVLLSCSLRQACIHRDDQGQAVVQGSLPCHDPSVSYLCWLQYRIITSPAKLVGQDYRQVVLLLPCNGSFSDAFTSRSPPLVKLFSSRPRYVLLTRNRENFCNPLGSRVLVMLFHPEMQRCEDAR